jgi:dihydrolipoamide dehydrogenase
MKFDVIIIGAGSAGYPCAIRLGQLGRKVLVVEEKELGGVCLNRGCIPTKALSFAAEMKDNFKKARTIGYRIDEQGLDLAVLRDWKDSVVKRLRSGITYLFKQNSVEQKNGKARILSEHKIECTLESGATAVFESENIVVAAGTEIMPLPGLDFDHKFIIDTDDALELKEIPGRLLVVGAGASGLELGSIYSRLGSKVTVVEIMEQILPGMEYELCEQLYKILKKSGIEIFLNSQVSGYETIGSGDEGLAATIKKADGATKMTFDRILVTVGRRPVDNAFKKFGLAADKEGYLTVDGSLRTSARDVYAIGDIIGTPLLAHKATKQGVVCAEIIGGEKTKYEPRKIPSCVFTIPPLSTVGMTEKEAAAKGMKIKIGRFPYRASGKALTMGETEGLVKIIGDENDRLIGLHILGAESPSLIAGGMIEVEQSVLIRDLTEIIYPHPTLTEIIGEAAENYFKKATHIRN